MAVELHTGIGFIVHSEPMGNVPSLVLFARNSTRELTSQPYCTQLFSEANLHKGFIIPKVSKKFSKKYPKKYSNAINALKIVLKKENLLKKVIN